MMKNDFLTYLTKKYQKGFKTIDEYLFFLYKDFTCSNKMKYYQTLEEDIILYSKLQIEKRND